MHWVPGLRERLLDSETPPLSRSELVVGPRRSLVGRLCPNAELADGRRFDDVATGSFVLVSAVPLLAEQRRLLAARGATLIEAPAGSPLHAWLSAAHVTAALVRPDHTVARAGRDVGAICAAVPRLCVA